MKTRIRKLGDETWFILRELEPELVEAAESLGFEQVGAAYVKSFLVPPEGIAELFAAFQRRIEMVLRQKAGLVPTPWRSALQAVLTLLAGTDVDWRLVGSAALAIRGVPLRPCDIDLVVAESSLPGFERAMEPYLIEPNRDVGDWFWQREGRAFLHARIEWVSAICTPEGNGVATEFLPTGAIERDWVTWHGQPVPVTPLALQYAISRELKQFDRARMMRRLVLAHHEPA